MKTTRELKIIGVAICSALGLAMSGCGDDTNNPPVYDGENYLYLNTAAEGGANDQALIVDANPNSTTYGKIIKSIDYGSKHNEPHHAGISHDKKSIYMMGLFPPGRVWKLDIAADPKNPTLSHLVEDAATEIGANDPDEIVTMDDGTFLISFMGSAGATAPGAIARFNAAGDKTALFEVPSTETSSMAFSPHGFDVRNDIKRMANGSFVMPADAAGFLPTSGATFSGYLTVWSFDAAANTASVIHTYDLSEGRPAGMGQGIMDVKMLPGDAKGRVVATNMLGGEVWLVTTIEPFEQKKVVTGLQFPQLIQLTRDGKTMYVSSYVDNTVRKYDIANPEAPVLLGMVAGPDPAGAQASAGAHAIRLSADEKRIYVTSYFVNLKDDSPTLPLCPNLPCNIDANTVDFSGNRQLWMATTADMKRDAKFFIDFSGTSVSMADGTAITGGPFGPHSMVLDK